MEAFDDLIVKAEAGDAKAQFEVGSAYFKGEGTTKDYAKAYEWFSKSAKQGNPLGIYNFGSCYIHGIGVPIDDNKGIELIRKAAALNLDRAKEMLKELNVSITPKIKNPRLFILIMLLISIVGVPILYAILGIFFSSLFWRSLLISVISFFACGGIYDKVEEFTTNENKQASLSIIPLIITLIELWMLNNGIGWLITGILFGLIVFLNRFKKSSGNITRTILERAELNKEIFNYIEKINNTPESKTVTNEDKQEYILRLRGLSSTLMNLSEIEITKEILKNYEKTTKKMQIYGTIGKFKVKEIPDININGNKTNKFAGEGNNFEGYAVREKVNNYVLDYIVFLESEDISRNMDNDKREEAITMLKKLSVRVMSLGENDITREELKKYTELAQRIFEEAIGLYTPAEWGGLVGLIKNVLPFTFKGKEV
jgi:hypothetical protein